ncbi:MAG: metal ABC transporter ATP-binding protein [Pseudonocardiales bacterium]|nr:ATP-binding cassette domain-containing protein [Actinomycetota bacterium]PZS19788.1 MAG: metal ABC transporter ATP-binding protein [Pseudonocardiales bacterium]
MNAHSLNSAVNRQAGHTGQPRAQDQQVAESVITLRNAAAERGGRRLWSGLDLTVAAGEFVAVLGPNGVGKSTLVQVILGALPLVEGEVRVLCGPAGRANERIGYLPQRRSFDPSLRVRGRDIVRLGLDGHRWGLPLPAWLPGSAARRSAATRVEEVIDLVGAGGYADRPVGELSGGEQQRLLIAQALAPAPDLLLLDEPLDSLDLPNQAAVAALIARISRAQQVSVLMVAHDVNPILTSVDTVVYLAPGGSKIGSPRQVITGPTLTQLFGTPIEVLTTSDGRLVVIGHPQRCEPRPQPHGELEP